MSVSPFPAKPGEAGFSQPVNRILPDTAPKGIALFDLDGTLLAWDCQLLFRHFVVRREPWRIVFLPLFLVFTPLAPMLGAETMKRVFLSFLWKIDRERLDAYAMDFAKAVMPAIYLETKIRLEEQRAAGHFLILASASPEFYVREIGRLLGFDLVLGTPVEPGPLFPDLTNHKGVAKVKRLREVLPAYCFENDKLVNARGFTDSCADLPMLGICDTATVVNPSAELTRLAEENGWEIVRPARPWKSRLGFAARALALLLAIGRDPGGLRTRS